MTLILYLTLTGVLSLSLLFSSSHSSSLFSLHHLAQLPREGSAVTPLSRTQMGIRKSGLVSNNYRNYFNILKQKDREIYLFEMLTVSLNFHCSVCVCVFLCDRQTPVKERCVRQVCCIGPNLLVWSYFFKIESNISTCLRTGS